MLDKLDNNTKIEMLYLSLTSDYRSYLLFKNTKNEVFYERMIKYNLKRMLAMKFDGMMQTISK